VSARRAALAALVAAAPLAIASEPGGGGALAVSPAVVFPGCRVTFDVATAPSARVALAGSLSAGPIERGGLALCLGRDARLVASGRAGAGGAWSARLRVPPRRAALGREVFFQAATRAPGFAWRATNGASIVVGAAAPAFSDATDRITTAPRRQEAAVAVDIDRDGDLDVVTVASLEAAGDALAILVNIGGAQGAEEGAFVEETASRLRLGGAGDGTTNGLSLAAGDVDGDGFPDLVVGSDDNVGGSLNRANTLLRNAGDGTFDAIPSFPGGAGETQSICLADLDADGDLDLLCGNGVDRAFPEANELFVNQGGAQAGVAGTFVAAPFDAAIGETDAIVAADFDEDGALDLFVARDGRNRLLRGDGALGFADASASLPPLEDNSAEAVVADFDRDGHADVLVVNVGDASYVLFGDGAGGFARSVLPATSPTAFLKLDGAAGDLDGDGDADVVLAIHSLGDDPGLTTLLNRGGLQGGTAGTFEWAPAVLDGVARRIVATDVVIADLDRDGDADVWAASNGAIDDENDRRDQLLLNDACRPAGAP